MKFFLSLGLFLATPSLLASESAKIDRNQNWGPDSCAPKLVTGGGKGMAQCLSDVLKRVGGQTIRQSIKATGGVDDIRQSCVSRYNEMYSDGALKIVAAMGYFDSPPLDVIYSTTVSSAMIRSLKARCRPGVYACGFRRSPDNTNRYVKYVKDLNGKYIPAIVDFTVPLLSNSDKYNRSKPVEQKQRSEAAAKTFFDAIRRGEDVVIYAGHSRDGGGPDFNPSVLTSNKLETDYDWYHKNKPGLKALKAALRDSTNRGTPPNLFASFSCLSRDHFYKTLKAASPNTGYMLSSSLTNEPWDHMATMTLIDSVLAMRCGPETNRAIKQVYPVYTLEGFSQ